MSARDRKILEELVSDCILFNLNENESLEYIRKRAVEIPVSRSNFYCIKQRISRNEVRKLEERLTNHLGSIPSLGTSSLLARLISVQAQFLLILR